MNTFKKIRNKVVETFRTKAGVGKYNAVEQLKHIETLEAQLAQGNNAKHEAADDILARTSASTATPNPARAAVAKAEPESTSKMTVLNPDAHKQATKAFDLSVWQIEKDVERKLKERAAEDAKVKSITKLITKHQAPNGDGKNSITMRDVDGGEDVVLAKVQVLEAQEKYRLAQAQAGRPTMEQINRNLYERTERTSNAEVFNVTKERYKICYDVCGAYQRVFVCNTNPSYKVSFDKWEALQHQATRDAKGNIQYTDLTKDEFLSILSGRPSFEQLRQTYRTSAQDNVTFNATESTPLW